MSVKGTVSGVLGFFSIVNILGFLFSVSTVVWLGIWGEDFVERMDLDHESRTFISFIAHHWLGFLAVGISSLLTAFIWWQFKLCLHSSDSPKSTHLLQRIRALRSLFLATFSFDVIASVLLTTAVLPLFSLGLNGSEGSVEMTYPELMGFSWGDFLLPDFHGASGLALAILAHAAAQQLGEYIALQQENQILKQESSLVI